jgi:hypothetical protein
MTLEKLENSTQEKRYNQLFELSKRYMTSRGYSYATLDIVSRILPIVEKNGRF